MGLNDLVPFRHRRRQAARSDALSPFERMHDEMDRIFNEFMPQLPDVEGLGAGAGTLASIDLSETDDALELKADLPGMEEKDLNVTLRNGAVTISGERKYESEETKKNFYRAERAYGSFSRSVSLPCEVDEERVEAHFKNGVLTVRLPKSATEKHNQRKIDIKTG